MQKNLQVNSGGGMGVNFIKYEKMNNLRCGKRVKALIFVGFIEKSLEYFMYNYTNRGFRRG